MQNSPDFVNFIILYKKHEIFEEINFKQSFLIDPLNVEKWLYKYIFDY